MSEEPESCRRVLKREDEESIRKELRGKGPTEIAFFLDEIDQVCASFQEEFNPGQPGFRDKKTENGHIGYRPPINSNEIRTAINKAQKVLDKGAGLWPPKIFNTLQRAYDEGGNLKLPLKLKYESLLSDVHEAFRNIEQLLDEYDLTEKPKRQNPGGDRFGFAASILFAYKELWGQPTENDFEPLLQAVNDVLHDGNKDRSLKADIQRAFDQVRVHEENRKINIETAKKKIENSRQS